MKPLCLSLAALLLPLIASAIDPLAIKVAAKNVTHAPGNLFGSAVALNETYLVVGERANDDGGLADAGAAHVFNAVTGAWLRKLVPTTPQANAKFGYSVAISGNLAIIGAPTANNRGIVYVFDLSTGKQVALWNPPESLNGFGISVAASGDLAVVGHLNANGNHGSAYVYDLKAGTVLRTLNAADGAAGDGFGASVGIDGNIVIVGAPNDDNNTGSVYFFDATSGQQSNKVIAGNSAAGDAYGYRVAIAGGRSLVGAPFKNGNRGAAYVLNNQGFFEERSLTASDATASSFYGIQVAMTPHLAVIGSSGHGAGSAYVVDVLTGRELRQLVPTGHAASEALGWGEALALSGNNLALGAKSEGISTTNASEGAAYLFTGLVGPLPFEPMATQGSYAPGTRIANFGILSEGFINEQAEVSVASTLAGVDSNAGKDTGVFTSLKGPFIPALRSRDTMPNVPNTALVSAVTPIAFNEDDALMVRATLTGPGITPANNTLIVRYDTTFGLPGSSPRLGDGPVGPNGPIFAGFDQVVQSRSTSTYGFANRFKVGTNGVSATSDSGITLYASGGGHLYVEGDAAPDTGKYGQFSPRLAYGDGTAVWAAMRTGQGVSSFNDQAVYERLPGQSAKLLAIKNGDTPTAGLLYSSFLGESSSMTNDVVGRATVAGTGVTAANNQLIYRLANNADAVVARVGDPIVLGGKSLKWKTVTNFWPLPSGAVLLLGTVSGTGVTAANDQVLVLFQQDNHSLLLAREGDAAPGCSGARLGAISRVDSSMGGPYAFIASLTGAAADSNLALFTGDCFQGNDTNLQALRKPFLKLRKGTRYNTPIGTSAKVLSFSLPTSSTDATGAGNKGLGRAINNAGELTFLLMLDDKTTQLVRASP